MYTLKNGSVIDAKGNILFFGVDKFINDICLGNHCFICGKSPSNTAFNNEHVLPKWILKKYDLYNRKITLPNNSDFRYDKYVIPCCIQCNNLMNKVFEQPIKKLVEGGYTKLTDYLIKEGPWRIFVWLNILFLKTHLKDKSLKLHRKKKDNLKISDFYTWEELFHIHCVARSFYTRANLNPNILGSLLILPAKELEYLERFDYLDIYDSKSILLRLNDIVFITVLNDSCFSYNLISHTINNINNSVSPIQYREIFVKLSFANMHLKYHPEYYSEINFFKETYKISANIPAKIEINKYDIKDLGEIMFLFCNQFLNKSNYDEYKILRRNIKRGNYTFIHDPNGKFASNSMDFIQR